MQASASGPMAWFGAACGGANQVVTGARNERPVHYKVICHFHAPRIP
jgi:hypothetical protein